MRSVYKYRLRLNTLQTIDTIVGDVVKVALQAGEITVWVLGDIDKTEPRTFLIVGTGHAILDDEALIYHDAVFDGAFVWHVLERAA